MIVEDEALVAADIEQRLQGLGYDVAATVDSGEDAVSVAARCGLDLALMDIRLRGSMSGIEAASLLSDRHQIPVVYLTSHADSDTLAQAGKTAPFGFIVKPFEEHDLRATIEMAFCRARAERKILAMERWLATTLDSIGDGVIATDLEGRTTFLNRMAERLTGWHRAEALGRSIADVFCVRTVESEPVAMRLVNRAVEKGHPIQVDGRLLLSTRDGRELVVDDSAAPIRDDAGLVVGVVVVFRDRTEQDQLLEQRRRIEKKLQETQKLESLGVLAGGIAHDFNNLLTGILGNTSLALEMIPNGSPIREYMGDVQLASQRAADLVRQLLAYSGRGRFVIEQLDVSALVEETAKLISLSISKRAQLRLDLARGLSTIAADPSQIRQVVMNLVINASEAIGDRPGSIYVRTRTIPVDQARLEVEGAGADLSEGRYVELEVRDTGRGISREHLARIFDPFFTTKSTGRGLGLAAVVGIVRSHRGTISVESEVGRGTVFRILLPCAEGHPANLPHVRRSGGDRLRGSGRVLVIDDEPLVRASAGNILKVAGYEVVSAADGPDGVALFSREPASFLLVLLDLTMPSMDGLEVFTELRRIDPASRIILMSGFGEMEATRAFSNRGLSGYLQKPFDAEALVGAIEQALA